MAKPVIAVIDDDPIVLRIMSMLLTLNGYEVVSWSEAATACGMIRQRQPELVTLDLQMQGDWNAGLKVLECLYADPVTSTIPVIIVSATADTLQGADRRLAELPYARLVKPVVTEELYDLVASALRLPRATSHEGCRT